MKKEIYLHIPEPCHQNWDAMMPAEKGRFCESCKKEVVDFSVMTDKEILRVISKSSNGTCARISSDQLDKPLIKESAPIIHPHRFFLSAFIPAFLFAGKATSQNTLKNNMATIEKQSASYSMVGGIRPYSVYSITGSVTLPDGTPAADAIVTTVEAGKETKADKYGRFSIDYPREQAKVTLQVLTKGYYAKEVEVERDKIKPLHIKLTAPEILIGKTSFNHNKADAKSINSSLITKSKIINGRAESEDGEALANATIQINSTNKTTITGNDGRFTISIDSNEPFAEITATYVGYRPATARVELTGKAIDEVTIKMKAAPTIGEVVVVAYPKITCTSVLGGVSVSKRVTVADTAKRIIAKVFKNEMFKVFPNPVAKDARIHITFSEQGAYTLHLLDNTGKLYMVKEMQVDAKQPSQMLMPVNINAGIYYIKAINKRTNKQFTDKIVIQ